MSSEHALAELRVTTRAEHDRIEDILRLTEPMSMARYAVVMSGFDAFLRAWEPRIHQALPPRLQQWFRTRRRGGFASADVEWLRAVAGMVVTPPDASVVDALTLDELADVLGSLYVIEGSALGGRVIAPHLKSSLRLGAGHGASYFHGFGGETGVMWRDFRMLASLEIGESSRATVRACRSAQRTFAALIDIFAPLAPPAPPLAPSPSSDDFELEMFELPMLEPTTSASEDTLLVLVADDRLASETAIQPPQEAHPDEDDADDDETLPFPPGPGADEAQRPPG